MIRFRLFLQRQDVGVQALLASNCSLGFMKCKYSPSQPCCFTWFQSSLFSPGSADCESATTLPLCAFSFRTVCEVDPSWVEKVVLAVARTVVLGDQQPGHQLVLHWLVIGTIWECCCDLEVSSLNSCTPVLLFSFTFNNIFESKVVEGALISLINLIKKILEYSAFVC